MFLITGAEGQLGQSFKELLKSNEAIFCTHHDLDITKAIDQKKFSKLKALINCAAYTNVEKAEDEPDKTNLINAEALNHLAEFCNQKDIPLIHFSTDYVFDGKKNQAYLPNDQTHALNVYGKSKLAGEKIFLAKINRGLIIRTSWVYSPYGNNFVKTMLRLGKEKNEINVVSDQWGSPTSALDLAKATLQILTQEIKEKNICHFTNKGIITWFDFARVIMEMKGLSCLVKPIPTSSYKTKAERPLYSVLDCTQIKKDYGITLCEWKISLKECLERL